MCRLFWSRLRHTSLLRCAARGFRRTRSLQEIEIAAFFRLQHALGIEPLITAWRERRGLPSGLAPHELRGVDVEIDAPLAHREAYPITAAHERERTADGGFGRDVQHDRPIRRAAHARVGDAHHILDT